MSVESLAKCARKVLKLKTQVPINQGVVLLKEKDVMEVKVIAVPADVTVIKVEQIGSLSGVRGQFRSRCDFLILFQIDGTDAAVFVELKKTIAGGMSKGLEQLRRSPPYLEYLRTLCSIYFERRAEPLRRVDVGYVLIGRSMTPQLEMRRVSDPQVLEEKSHQGIVVRLFVGERIRFDRLRPKSP